ncbi:MAG: AAA family ATPase [Candidatus Lokiarchaeota archaeon]|nr:AAA family ATPase [Candidatus Lokiarchaeota archaeon]
MYIKEITYKNYKLFKSLKVSLERGLNLVQGENSVGKTGLLKSIVWMFWGSARGIEGLLRRGENHMMVKMIYHNNGNQYKIIKEYIKDKDEFRWSFSQYKNNEWVYLLDSTKGSIQRILKTKIEKTLGIKENTFMSLLYFKQKQFYDIIHGGYQVKGYLDYILNIMQINTLYEIIKQTKSQFKHDLENEDLIKKNLDNLTEQLDFNMKNFKKKQKRIKQLKDEVNKLREDNKSIVNLYNKCNKKVTIIDETVSLYNKIIARKDNIAAIKKQYIELEKSGTRIKKYRKLIILRRNIRKKKGKINNLTEKIININNGISEIEVNIENCREIIRKINIAGDEGICPMCQQKVPKEHIKQEIGKQEITIDNYEKETKELQVELQTIKKIKNSTEEELHVDSQNLSKVRDALNLLNSKFLEYIKAKQDYKETTKEFKEHYKSTLKKVRDIFEDYNNISKSEIDLTNYQAISLNTLHKQFNEVFNYTNVKQQDFKEVLIGKQDLLQENIHDRNALDNQISNLNDLIKEKTEKLETIKLLKKNKLIYDRLEQSIISIKEEIRQLKISELEKLVYKWYTLLVTKPQFHNLQINPEDYSIQIYPIDAIKKQYVDLRGNLSGGNETLLAIAERLALARRAGGDIILLDEPTDGTDENNIISEVEGLSNITQIFEQIIMITHYRAGIQFANNVITLKKNLKNNITKIK